jgi:hypothetical protein
MSHRRKGGTSLHHVIILHLELIKFQLIQFQGSVPIGWFLTMRDWRPLPRNTCGEMGIGILSEERLSRDLVRTVTCFGIIP